MAVSVTDVSRFARSTDRRLIIEATVLLLLVRLGLWTLSFDTLRRWLGGIQARDTRSTNDVPKRVAWAIAAVARRLPFRITCLVETLAAHAMLRRCGLASTVRFGVKGGAGRAIPIDAHAWLECDGAVIVGQIENLREYAVLNAAADPARSACDR
jgi:hypothetical protein